MGVSTDVERDTAERDVFLARMTQSCLGVFDIAAMYLGVRLSLYRSLADNGPATSSQLAQRTKTTERYVREWLEQQTVTSVLRVDDEKAAAGDRRYSLPEAHAEVLLDADSLSFLGSYPQQLIGCLQPLPALIQAFQMGGGVPYEAYGADCRDGIAAANRVAFINLLGSQWFPAIPKLDSRLRVEPAARIADIGCGFGWSSISIARAYPRVKVDGFDLDQSSIDAARRNARSAGVGERVNFEVRDAGNPREGQRYDLVTAFETIHDMANPVRALAAMRGLIADDGIVLVVDEKVGDEFATDPGDVERLYYGWSLIHCLPAGMADQPSAGTGTVMRPHVLRRYAQEAGFRDIEVQPIDHDFWRFYRLLP